MSSRGTFIAASRVLRIYNVRRPGGPLRWLALLPLLLSPLAAPAGLPEEDASAAERSRLREDLERLTDKEAWKGVERVYPKLLDLDGLTVRDHLLAARSALHLGDTHQAHLRLQRALAVDPRAPVEGDLAEVRATLAEISEGYGRVNIVVEPGRQPALAAAQMPFEANPRASIERARDQLSSHRRFRGWLPVGRYEVDGTPFVVEPGAYWKEIAVAP